jgi:hypothetical protein
MLKENVDKAEVDEMLSYINQYPNCLYDGDNSEDPALIYYRNREVQPIAAVAKA